MKLRPVELVVIAGIVLQIVTRRFLQIQILFQHRIGHQLRLDALFQSQIAELQQLDVLNLLRRELLLKLELLLKVQH